MLSMFAPYKVLPALVFVALLGCATPEKPTPASSVAPAAPKAAAASDLESRLLGTWILAKAAVPGTPSGIGIRRKIFTPGRWEIIQPDPVTGAVVFNHGGSYRLNGDELEQKVEFASQKTANYVNQVRRFKITVEGDVYTQKGIGNQFSEEWRRLPDVK